MITRDMAAKAASTLGCEVAAVMAVAEVESANSGFLPDGRPVILFEALVFHNLTAGRFDAEHPGISSPVWNRALYKGGAGEWGRLAEAEALDRVAADKSASWGAFQIMGFNHVQCGFASVEDFVEAMKRSPDDQLSAFVAFISRNPSMKQALVAKNWPAFARLYNGPGAVASYAGKIEQAYQMHAREDAAAPVSPPIPKADPTAKPPAGYVTTAEGNVVRENMGDSRIVKAANDADTITKYAGAATTVGGAVSAFAGVDWKIMAVVGAVVAFGLIVFLVLQLTKAKSARLDMAAKGVA